FYVRVLRAVFALQTIKKNLTELAEQNKDFRNYVQYHLDSVDKALSFVENLLSAGTIETRKRIQDEDGGKVVFHLNLLMKSLKYLTAPIFDDSEDESRRKQWVGSGISQINDTLTLIEGSITSLNEANDSGPSLRSRT